MVRMRLLSVAILAVGVTSACLFFLLTRHYALLEPERWFVPGELGHEGGRRTTDPGVNLAGTMRLAVGRDPPKDGQGPGRLWRRLRRVNLVRLWRIARALKTRPRAGCLPLHHSAFESMGTFAANGMVPA